MRQYKLPGGAVTTITIGGFAFVSGKCIVAEKDVAEMEASLVRYAGVTRDTAGEAAGGWAGDDIGHGTYGPTVTFEKRANALQNMSFADVWAVAKTHECTGVTKQKMIQSILEYEHPGFYEADRNLMYEGNLDILDGDLTITTVPGGTMTDGAPFSQQPVVKVRAINGLVDHDYTGPVTAVVSSGAGVVSGTATVNCVAGVATFTTLGYNNNKAGGTCKITFSTEGGANAVESGELTVTAAVAYKLGFATPLMSTTGNDGVVFAVQPKVQIQDWMGRAFSSTANVVAALQTGSGTLEGTKTKAAVAGLATFTDLYHINSLLGDDITLRFTSAGLVSLDSAEVAVGPAIATKLGITQQATGATTGQVFSVQPIVAVQDVLGRTMTGDDTTEIVTTLTTGAGVLGGTEAASFIVVDGLATYTNLKITEVGGGTDKITFTATGLTPIESNNIVTGA